jgi:CSLREA domain-containing protein
MDFVPTVRAASLSFTVTNTADTHDAAPGDGVCADSTGQCTLRAAVEEADAQARGSVMTVTIPAGMYLLPLGTVSLTRNTITLAGAGSSATQLIGQGDRLLTVAAGARLSANGVTLTGGTAPAGQPGGALANLGVVTLTNSGVLSNTAPMSGGGGLYNGPGASLALVGSVVQGNSAPRQGGGGIANQGTLWLQASQVVSNSARVGGAVASSGLLTATDSTVSGNIVTGTGRPGGGGAGLYNNSGVMTVIDSTVANNSAGTTNSGGSGGGVYNARAGTLVIATSTISGNSGFSGAGILSNGTLVVVASLISNNTATTGGGIATTGTATVSRSTVSGNRAFLAGEAGGIINEGTLTVTASTISGNTADTGGGGIDNYGVLTLMTSTLAGDVVGSPNTGGGLNNVGTASVEGSTFSGDVAEVGGGIFDLGMLTVTTSSFSGNRLYNGGGAGLAVADGGVATVTNSTFSGNVAPAGVGGGIYNFRSNLRLSASTIVANSTGLGSSVGSTTVLTDTIVANSASGSNCTGIIAESAGYNLDSGTSCGFTATTDLSNTNPLLGPLAYNGGPTPTIALLPGSPAIDHGGSRATGCPATDQRGVARPQGPACDIGAFELVP